MYTGLTGRLTVDGKKVAYISNWSVENSVEIIEFASLGKSTRHKKAGLKSWTASADGTIVFGLVDGRDSCHKDLFDAMNSGKPVNCEFYLDTKNNTKFTGCGLIESLSVDLSTEDKGNISISISGMGVLEYCINGKASNGNGGNGSNGGSTNGDNGNGNGDGGTYPGNGYPGNGDGNGGYPNDGYDD